MNKLLLFLTLLIASASLKLQAQTLKQTSPGAGNPILPGYFADPTVKKFNGRYFIYATTDGTGWGLGPSQVWYSDDFVNWTKIEMNWPTTEVYWAPDVWLGKDDQYYMYYSQPVQLHGGVSDTPYGPWIGLTADDEPIVPDRFVKNVITLDGQSFQDDDGSIYLYWGTWGIYDGFGAGWAKFNPDMKSFESKGIIPNTEATDFFEAPFMFKRGSTYYFTYSSGSCHDGTYRVQYATSQSPTGPFTFADNNPILATNEDGSIHGPGHHSILKEGDQYYIIYHRHDNPHSSNGFHRQVAADKLEFDDEGRIKKIIPTHEGVGFLGKNTNPFPNLLYGKKVKASSQYNDDFQASYTVDDNYGTLWMPASDDSRPTLEVDLGSEKDIKRTRIAFQYATHFFQYLIEYSLDGKAWKVYADKTRNIQDGSPMTDYNQVKVRYLKLTITGVGKQGFPMALWNFSAYDGYEQDPEQMLVNLQAADIKGNVWLNNRGMYGGMYQLEEAVTGVTAGMHWVSAKGGIKGSVPVPAKTNPTMDYTLIASFVHQDKLEYVYISWNHLAKDAFGMLKGSLTINQSAHDSWYKTLKTYFETGRIVTNEKLVGLKVFNRRLAPSEAEYYGLLPYKTPPKASLPSQGMLVSLNANDLKLGSMAASLDNDGLAKGAFNSEGSAPVVELVAGKKALLFDGHQSLKSDFITPLTLTGNNPFTVEAWIYNHQIAPAECLVDWAAQKGRLLTSSRVLYGSNPSSGAVSHQEWADMGFKGGAPEASKWHHIVITFDGYMEKVYVDGELNDEEQKMLFVEPGSYIHVGNSANKEVPFSGALASLKMYDKALNHQEIKSRYAAEGDTDKIAVYFSAAGLGYDEFNNWPNQGKTGGTLQLKGANNKVKVVHGKLALEVSKKSQWSWNATSVTSPKENYYIILNAYTKGQWHEYVFTKKGNDISTYVDGEPANTKIFDKMKLTSLSGGNWSWEGDITISLFALIEGHLTSDEVQAHWKRSLNVSNKSISNVEFTKRPVAMNSVAAFMKAQSYEGQPVKYLFIGGENKHSQWQRSPEYMDHSLGPDKQYNYYYLVQDQYGNIIAESDEVAVSTDKSTYTEFFHTFDENKQTGLGNYFGFDGALLANDTTNGTTEIKITNGSLKLASSGGGWDGQLKNGAFIYKEVKGDFVMEVELKDYAGLSNHKSVAYNDGGIMVALPQTKEAAAWDLLSLSFFPLYNQGNLFTNQSKQMRYQKANLLGWEAHRFLQIQRIGSQYYFRTSENREEWVDMPGSPVERVDFEGKKLRVGLWHATYSNNEGYVVFDDFRLSEKK
ncbi:family 43 glycosylhydrolase [Fulvivirga sediminis]|uniref:Family 43 glycosylhydrolase n=1 Tax=Fulvivirga sediminis TaxID=2803949 RepID=A0A937K031_9BACT|nr:family 43 glycosylhydrolase [Fulvivirga sediminis]MBL3655915.1 family 43 glycosylhydrolase [Fulvivirga sediminis]